MPQAGHRGDQRAGRRRRRDDAAADGHPSRLDRGALRPRVRAPRHRPRGGRQAGSCRESSASAVRSSGRDRADVRRAGGARGRARAQRPRAGRPAAGGLRARAEIADNAAPVSIALTRQMLLADGRAPIIRWRRTRSTRAGSPHAARRRTPSRASMAFLEKRPRRSRCGSATTCPDFFPGGRSRECLYPAMCRLFARIAAARPTPRRSAFSRRPTASRPRAARSPTATASAASTTRARPHVMPAREAAFEDPR